MGRLIPRRRSRPAWLIVGVLASILGGCDGSPVDSEMDLRGTYVGGFDIIYSASLANAHCSGPATVTITSSRAGVIEGSWSFGPNTHPSFDLDPNYSPICNYPLSDDSLDWDRTGTLAGNVAPRDSLRLSLLEPSGGAYWPPTGFFGHVWRGTVRGDVLQVDDYWLDGATSYHLVLEGVR